MCPKIQNGSVKFRLLFVILPHGYKGPLVAWTAISAAWMFAAKTYWVYGFVAKSV